MKKKMMVCLMIIGILFSVAFSASAFTKRGGEYIYLKQKFIDASSSPRKEVWINYEVFITSPLITLNQERFITQIEKRGREVVDSFMLEMTKRNWIVERSFRYIASSNIDAILSLDKWHDPKFVINPKGVDIVIGFDPNKPLGEFFERVDQAILDYLYENKLFPY